MEADECNFLGLGAAASEGAEMLLGLGAVALGGRSGAGGCPGKQRKERAVRPRRRGGGEELQGRPWAAPLPRSWGFWRSRGLRGRALTCRDDVPRTEQLQVREDAHEVGHAGVAVDPGPQDAGRALPGALA